MKVQLVGTGSILTESLSACALVDGMILVDAPNGSMKALRRLHLDPKAIDICLVTHFHADHYFDLPFLLMEQGLRSKRHTPLYLIGPRGLSHRLQTLTDLAYPNHWDRLRDGCLLDIRELASPGRIPGSPTLLPPIEAVAVEHEGLDAYGYLISGKGRTIGFTGDTALCEGVHRILSRSTMAIVDMSFPNSRSGHMGLTDVQELQRLYGATCTILPTHMTDAARVAAQGLLVVPTDGQVFEVQAPVSTTAQ